jgi:hypothetical protein
MASSRFALPLVPLLLAAASAPAAPRWTFDVALEPQNPGLGLRACSEIAQPQVRFIAGAAGASRHLTTQARDSGRAVHTTDEAIVAHDWQAGECLRVRIDIDAAQQRLGRTRRPAGAEGLLLDPRHWLWRPTAMHPDSTIRFELPAGWKASVPWTSLPDAPQTYRLGASDADWPALTAFAPLVEHRLTRPGGVLRVALLPPWSDADIARVEPVVDALMHAFGRLPRTDAQILVVPLPGRREAAPWGQVQRGGGAAVHLFVGADAPRDALIEDWTATHEFAHLLHPHLGLRGRWLSEGLASYYQNVLRARVGVLTADAAWSRIEQGFARGRAEQRSVGLRLEQASRRLGELRAYMRTYWAGTAFWLEADLGLHERGSSLDAVLAAHASCCLGADVSVTPEGYLAQLDRIAGRDVFMSRYHAYAAATTFPDTDPMLSRLRASPARAAIMQARAVD